MAVETADERAIFLADFGVACSYTPSGGTASDITVIFDNEFIDVDTTGTVTFAMQQPKVLCRDGEVSNIAEGDQMVIAGVTYIVRVVMPDGTGMTEVMLEAQ